MNSEKKILIGLTFMGLTILCGFAAVVFCQNISSNYDANVAY